MTFPVNNAICNFHIAFVFLNEWMLRLTLSIKVKYIDLQFSAGKRRWDNVHFAFSPKNKDSFQFVGNCKEQKCKIVFASLSFDAEGLFATVFSQKWFSMNG